MRLWSLHPSYLDRVGLIAVWREGLLAKKVLEGNTKGYTNHPQLIRFKLSDDQLLAINTYLHAICDEATKRGYNFDRSKLPSPAHCKPLHVTNGQLMFEWEHLGKKLQQRSPEAYTMWRNTIEYDAHPLFIVIDGSVESWERV